MRAVLTTLMGTAVMHHCSTYNNGKECPQGGFSIYAAVTNACALNKKIFFYNVLRGNHQYGEHVLSQLHCLGETSAPVD